MATALSVSAKGVSTLILIQVISRASTFIVNQALLRYLSPELLGTSLRLELFSITVLFFGRESLRVALQRQTSNAQTVINLGYLAVALGLPLSLVLGWRYALTSSADVTSMPAAVAISAIANVVELLSEPAFALVQQKLAYGIRATAETTATIVRCFVTFGIVVLYDRKQEPCGALPFAYGQLAYATLLTLTYYASIAPIARKEGFSVLPRAIKSSDGSHYIFSYFSQLLCTLTFSLYIQSGIKYLLTQGDSIVIAAFASLQDQGIYGMASNYGGLIARVIFQPIEESSRNIFAKLCPSDSVDEKASTHSSKATDISAANSGSLASTAESSSKESRRNLAQGLQMLTSILHLYLLLAIIAFAVGPSLAPALLGLVAGEQWRSTGAGSVLAAYTYYIPFLAINGVTEGFVAAVANNAQLRTQSIAMTFYFVGFAVAIYTFLTVAELGAVGLVWANCVNMACRILWNAWFIRAYFGKRDMGVDLSAMLPSPLGIASAAIAAAAVRRDSPIDYVTLHPAVDDLIWPTAVTAVLGVAMLLSERKFLLDLYSTVAQRPK